VIHEDAAHLAARHGEKMPTALDLERSGGGQPQVRFVDQRGGLQNMSRPFVAHLAGRDAMQLSIDAGGGLLGGCVVAFLHPDQQQGEIAGRVLRGFWDDRHFRSVYNVRWRDGSEFFCVAASIPPQIHIEA